MKKRKAACPDCGGKASRRDFLRAAAAGAAAAALAPRAWAGSTRGPGSATPEELAVQLFKGLKDEQRKAVCFPWEHENRMKVMNNWEIVPQTIGKFFSADQQGLIADTFRALVSEEGYGRYQKAFKDDAGGFEHFHVAMFGTPESGKFAWVTTGRHLTIRCDGDGQGGTAFGGPVFYGHATEFTEKPGHPGNVWWYQAEIANKIFQALDGAQREKALVDKSLPDVARSVRIRGAEERHGIAVAGMSADQKALVEGCLKELLKPYRAKDVEEALALVKEAGGTDAMSLGFYKDDDLGGDGVWDRWILQGPALTWYFRGSPHVHTWVNVGKPA